ncbi:AAC(3) family N-acetyltransferase [Phycobacter azelaicus]|uniref:AAC(3) family N-acetyltransferase n=1 Tax=Phycobacter azelaicus TaxID=2668075 RepID=UPI00186895A3|nr:AAC(3) family N-acetyltransferase [Phycobacter azelaicus]MBE1295627.1 hypothetical protein [Paracoccaceae bacterium]
MTRPLNDLVESWQRAGIAPGDTVLIHSSIRRTSALGYSAEDIKTSFLEAVGPEGTVLFPLFNFDFCKGVPFDMRSSPSHMGALTEAARQDPRAIRTGHPVYSFAVIGAHAEVFRDLCNSSGYGTDSPFAMLRRMQGKIAVLDLMGQNSMTFYHHVEEILDVDYRYHKAFTAPYTDHNGIETTRTFSIFVRDIERGVLTHVNPMDDKLWELGLYSGCKPKEDYGLRVIDARSLFDAVADVIRKGRAEGQLYRIDST